MSNPKFIVAIAGNIGAGKSTLTHYLAEKWHFDIVPEPESKNPFLKNFYVEPKKWAFHSQMFFLTERARLQRTAEKNSQYLLLDRTIYEDAEVFARILLSGKEYRVYKETYNLMLEMLTPPNFIVYLRASVNTLMQRINARGRKYEKDIKKSYIKKLNIEYERWISKFSIAPVICIDTDKYELFSLFKDMDKVREEIENFFWYGRKNE